jgi:hypothetical protein
MVDKLTRISLSTSRSFYLFFDFIVFKVEKASSHGYDVEKGSKISKALFMIVGYLFLREIQNESRESPEIFILELYLKKLRLTLLFPHM